MSANLITGNLFKPIYAYQDADYQAGISGNVTSIMPVGSQMALSIEDANTIKADDGVLITKEGRRIQIDAGAIEEWSIPTGTQGVTNYFIIGFHLYTDSNSAEVCETFVEQMENSTDTIPEDTFREGATEVYVSLGRVVQSGINLDSITSLVQIAQSFEDVKNAISQLNSDKVSKTGDTITGNLIQSSGLFQQKYNNDVKIQLSSNNEGGNILLYPPNSITTTGHWEFDAYDGNLRLFYIDGGSVKSSFIFPRANNNGILKLKQCAINIGKFSPDEAKYNQKSTVTLDTGFASCGVVGCNLHGFNYTRLTIGGVYCYGTDVTWTVSNNTSMDITNDITLYVYILEIRETLLA